MKYNIVKEYFTGSDMEKFVIYTSRFGLFWS